MRRKIVDVTGSPYGYLCKTQEKDLFFFLKKEEAENKKDIPKKQLVAIIFVGQILSLIRNIEVV